MNRPHLVMPMAGGGTRFVEKGFDCPKPLIEIEGRPFFYWATISLGAVRPIDITFVVLQQHVDEHHIDRAIQKYFPNAALKIIPSVLPGAVCTCLKGVEDINDGRAVIFNDCDHMFECRALSDRINRDQPIDFDGALLTFESDEPKFSYVRFDESGTIVGTREKQVVSNRAICGAYVFANAELFRQMSARYFETCQYREYFVSGVYNELCLAGKKVVEFGVDFHLSFGTPTEFETAQGSKYFERVLDQ